MTELEEKLNQVLNNPQMMQQILTMAQSMGFSPPAQPPQPSLQPEQQRDPLPMPDPGILQKAASMASSTGVDANQRALLRALNPYVSRDRVNRLEKAMRAAKVAVFASSMLQSQNRR